MSMSSVLVTISTRGNVSRGNGSHVLCQMRGPLSDQPKKIGEHVQGAVDQIYHSRTVSLARHAWWVHEIPNLLNPHLRHRQTLCPTKTPVQTHTGAQK